MLQKKMSFFFLSVTHYLSFLETANVLKETLDNLSLIIPLTFCRTFNKSFNQIDLWLLVCKTRALM